MSAPPVRSPLLEFLRTVYVPSRIDLSSGGIEQLAIVVGQLDRFAGSPEVGELTDEMVCGFLKNCLARGLSPVTVNGKRTKLLTLWRCAWRKRLHAELPRDVPRCREPRRVPRAWTAEEIQCLVNYAASLRGKVDSLPANWWWTTLILSIWETGMRVGAARSMMLPDFLQGGPALLARSTEGKTLLGQCLPITPPTAMALAEHIFEPPRELIWPWPHCRRWLFVSFRKIVKGTGLTASTRGHDLFHKIRRSHLSYVARESLELARRQAGHTSAAMTQRYYIDPIIAGGVRAVDLLPKITIE